MGYEYELLKRLAKDLELELEIKVVHNIDEISGGTMLTLSGCQKVESYVARGIEDLQCVLDFFVALIQFWLEEDPANAEFIESQGGGYLTARAKAFIPLMDKLISGPIQEK